MIAGPTGPVLIFLLRVADVSLATVRSLLIARRRELVPVIGFVEMIVWVFAVGATVQNLTSIWHLLAFAGGFAVGNWLGILIEERIALGLASVRVILQQAGHEIADFLRAAGFGVTEIAGMGKDGPVQILDLVLPRREMTRCVAIIEEEAPNAFVIVEEPRGVSHGYLGMKMGRR